MTQAMNGTWKMISSENFDAYMKALGVNAFVRKMISLAKPKVVININHNDFLYQSVSSLRKIETKCKLGEEFQEDIPDGNKCKSLIVMDGNKIIHTQKWDNDTKQTTIERFVDNEGHLIMEFTYQDVTCKRMYERA
ncbi:fatty acid-binding protein, adipocyte-like [Clavelina lepadiformis]|uniref:fatty acid-binding protein, adipocyte-like n=1 Tax=Clavelina lepadiformis TaxID=159417 RepID=UPI0040428DD4